MSALSAVIYREGKIRTTNLTFIFWDLFFPLGHLLVFSVGMTSALGAQFGAAGVDYNSFFLAGVLGMASFGIASNTSYSFFLDRDNGIFYEMLTYPLSRAEYLLGKVLFNVAIALVQSLITVLLGSWLLKINLRWDLLPLMLAAMAVGTAGWFFFYAAFALKIRRNDLFNALTSIFYFAFLFFSSMFYPLEPLPAGFRIAAYANPITWQVDVLRYATIGVGEPRVLLMESAAFVVFSVAMFAVAARFLREQE